MKKLLTLTLSAALCLSFLGCSQKAEEPENPYRPVSYQNEYYDNGSLTSLNHTEYRYNEQGFQTEALMFENGVLTTTKQYEHDALGNVLRVTSISEDAAEVHDINYTLDDRNRVLKMEESVDGVLSYIMEYTYDKNGNVLAETYTVMDNGVEDHVRHREMTYNRKGELIREIFRNEDGTYTRYDYEDGKKAKVSSYDSSDELLSYWEFTYNEAGQLIQESSYTCERDGDSRTTRLTNYNLYAYDETGLTVTKTSHYTEDRPYEHHTVSTYDEYGNELLHERYRDGELYWRITQEFERIP